MNPKIISLNIRTDGRPVAICPYDNKGNPRYDKVSLITFPIQEGKPERSYQVSYLGVKPFSFSALENLEGTELETTIDKLVQGKRKTREFSAINCGVPLQVYLNDVYTGLIFLGKRYDPKTRWGPQYRETIQGEFLGDLRIRRYENLPEVKSHFELIQKHVEEKNNRNPNIKRRAA
ncbi:Uncharacterised protein [uncultured archaeon]|nr:Uncharacterised protein [uncultured archaeon]